MTKKTEKDLKRFEEIQYISDDIRKSSENLDVKVDFKEENLDKEYSSNIKINKDKKNDRFTKEEKEYIAENNMKLIYHVAKLFESTSLSYDELISIGSVGFVKALNNYNKNNNSGAKFATFCIHCIKNDILFALRKEVRHNTHNESMNKILSTDKNGNNLELEEIISADKLEGTLVETNLLNQENRKIILRAMERLKEKEKIVLMYRYGFVNDRRYTQKEVADFVGMSQANISKIEKLALVKMKKALKKENFVF
ncbi:sigma-70 family RNA polymerase sigma factor [Clostridium perfringens]|uniref:sigma-70 family RNA polymerase sigma factor n=1 Tax=Clostridium perfringens TaxID=1502 RepID=UPI0024BD41CC|nr:sigma-70 family RNA polymerase sigma factor [Clostridium perfringens]